MKKFLIFVLIGVLVFAVIGCGTTASEEPSVAETEKVRTKEDAILEAQTDAINKACTELKKDLKNPSSLIINDAVFYYGEYDEETQTVTYVAVKLDYNATNSFGGSVRDVYTYFLVDISELPTDQVLYIMRN